ncbi:MAG: type II secretion system F family protein [Actinobacteria bacterium]|nr:type II secretion system F family protein [Actinomycetota bacterium]
MATTFEYKVRDRGGKLIEGQLEGDSMQLVLNKLREMGYLPIAVKPKPQRGLHREINIPGISNRIKLKELAMMSRQFATMVDSGLSIVRSLGVLSEQVENKELAKVLRAVRMDVERGGSLSEALSRHPKVFNPLYVTMVHAGEVGGNVDQVLSNLASMLERQADLQHKIRSAMTYPAVVLSIIGIIFIVMMVVIVPIFQHLFKSLGGTLPLPTRIVITVAHDIASIYLLVIVAVIALIVFAFRKWIATNNGRRHWDSFKLKPPIFGPLVHKVALARMSSTLSSLLASGVPILESLDIVSDTSGNRVVADALQEAKKGVREGQPLVEPLRKHEVITPLMLQMIDVGEQTGALEGMLSRISDFYNGEVETTVNNLTTILEPLLIVVMGIVVGAVIISLYLPMFDYIKLVKTS